ncbi:MAG: hypothetical protein AAGF19_00430 [Pseudomonadota bacterium]
MHDEAFAPTSLVHEVDRIYAEDGTLEQEYNWLEYGFEGDRSFIGAVSYLDDIEAVFIRGVFAEKYSDEKTVDDAHLAQVIAYLRERFATIRVPSDGSSFRDLGPDETLTGKL